MVDKRFFASTRGRIVMLLRAAPSTVSALAAQLQLTDNAVRGHLQTLERDGLVRQRGTRKATRKPHFAFELTEESERLFPKPYDLLLNQFLHVLKKETDPGRLQTMMQAVGSALAEEQRFEKSDDREVRIANALKVLETLGGAARIEREEGRLFIRGNTCPLAAVVCEHPEVCRMTERLISDIVGAPVRERCSHEESPKCCFEIDPLGA
jgi:predicted ArsR family transcriptional regulator